MGRSRSLENIDQSAFYCATQSAIFLGALYQKGFGGAEVNIILLMKNCSAIFSGACSHCCLPFAQFSHVTFSKGSKLQFSGHVILCAMGMDGVISSAGHKVHNEQITDRYLSI